MEEVSLGRSGPRSSRQETHMKLVGEAGAMLSDNRRLFRGQEKQRNGVKLGTLSSSQTQGKQVGFWETP